MIAKGKILVVAAHPDDEVLGCGGTMARLAREGHAVYIAIMGEGITSRYERREHAENKLIERLQANSREVACLLGAEDVFFYNLPDNRFDTVPLLDVIKSIEDLVEQLQPQVLYTHHCGDLNIDHAITHRAVLTAVRPIWGSSVKEIHSFEVPSSTEWSFCGSGSMFRPNVFVNISTTLEVKLQALRLYETECRSFPHPRSPEALRAIALYRGSIAGFRAAEAFELVRLRV